uniref:Uncharacterized protein n=1 Tax=viral metagenome TaxID=1070528 RepID=A0A6C0JT02_9ZZZZ
MFNDKITLNVAEAIAKVLNKNLDVSEGLIDDLKDNKKIRQETDWYHDKNDRQEKKKSEPNIKTFTGKYGKSNYKSVSENLSDIDEQKDVKHEIQVNRIHEDFEQEDVTYEEMNEGWGAREQQQRRDAQNKAWDELLDKHKEHPKNTEKLKNLRLKNWSAPAAEKMLREDSEQLDELSKKTLGNYVKTAGADLMVTSQDTGWGYKKGETEKNLKRMMNRYKGIKQAADKLTKEEFEQLDEVVSVSTIADNLIKRALGKSNIKRNSDHTSSVNKGDFIVHDRGAVVAKLEKGTWEKHVPNEHKSTFNIKEDLGQLDEVADKVYDPITKKNIKRKPIKIKMGGGYRKTVDGVVVDSSDKKEIGKKFSESLSIFSEKGLKGLFESIYSVSDETVEIINETSEFVGIPQSINTIRKTKEHLKVNTNLPKSIRKELEQKIEDHRKHLEKSGFDFKEDFDNIDWETLLEEPDSDEFAQEVKKAVRKNKGELRNDENIAKGEVLAVKNEEVEYIDEMKKLNKVNHVYSDVNAEKFADEYVKGHSGDYREGGPTKQDSEHSENFHTNYTTKHVKSGFAGGGKKIFTHNKTGEKFEVEIEPNGKTFYGNDHRVRKLNEEVEKYPFVAVHVKKGTHQTHGSTSYEAAQNAAKHWKLKSTAGIDVYRADKKHVAENVEDLDEAHMTDTEMEKREEIVKGMKKNLSSFKDRYGNRAKDVIYATATKKAMAD